MRDYFDERAAKLSEIYWDMLMDMTDWFDEEKVFNEVQIEKFYPCGNCGEPVYAPITFEMECPYCGEILQDN